MAGTVAPFTSSSTRPAAPSTGAASAKVHVRPMSVFMATARSSAMSVPKTPATRMGPCSTARSEANEGISMPSRARPVTMPMAMPATMRANNGN